MVPLLRELGRAPGLETTVLFMTRRDCEHGWIAGYGEILAWDVPLLNGCAHRLLPNHSPVPDGGTLFARLNLGVLAELRRERCDAVLLHRAACATDLLAWGQST